MRKWVKETATIDSLLNSDPDSDCEGHNIMAGHMDAQSVIEAAAKGLKEAFAAKGWKIEVHIVGGLNWRAEKC